MQNADKRDLISIFVKKEEITISNIGKKLEEFNKLKRTVDFNTYDFTVKELISLVKDSVISISPDYQRKFRWDEERQSSLIESILLGIPIPSIFMATNDDATWEVIDGVQRISTILNFVLEEDDLFRDKIGVKRPLKLKNLSKLKSFGGMSFKDFPSSLNYEFLLKPLKVITLSDKSDKLVRFDLFERLNTGGVVLSDQEIRSCIYKGDFNSFLKEKACNANFRKLVKLTESQKKDGSMEELVLRFFAYLTYRHKFVHSVKDFLNEYMGYASKNFDYRKYSQLFDDVFSQLSSLEFGIVKSKTRKITSFILFEAVSVGAAEAILSGKNNICTKDFYEWVKNGDLNKLITGATNSPTKVHSRIEFCKNKFIDG